MRTVEEFAKVTALLREGAVRGVPPQGLLASVGLEVANYKELERQWDTSIEDEISAGGSSKAQAFVKAYRKERARISREGLPAAAVDSRADASAVAPSLAHAAPETSRVVALGAVTPSPWSAHTERVSAVVESAVTSGAPVLVSSRVAVPAAALPVESMDATSTEFRALGPELPFGSEPSSGFLAELAARSGPPATNVGETQVVCVADLDLSEPPLPFEPSDVGALIGTHAAATEPSAPAEPPFALAGVAATPSHAPIPLTKAANSPLARHPASLASAPQEHGTLAPLTIEQYASLSAELAAAPGLRSEILVRYHTAQHGALEALDLSWARRFVANPSEKQLYERLVREFMVYLRSHHGSAR